MNLANLRTEAQRLAGRVDTDFNDRTRRWLNEAQEQWAIAVPWPTLVVEEDFTSFGTRQLVLPQRVKQVQWVADKTNRRPLDASNAFDREFPSSFLGDTPGAPFFWREVGVQAVIAQPVVGALSVRTTASDVFSVYLEGLAEDTSASGTPNQYFVAREQINVSSSGVHSGATLFRELHTIGKDDYTPADVVVRDTSSNVISRISAHAYRAEYRRIEFVHIPTSGTVFRVRYLRAPTPLVEAWHIPHTSVDTEYLIWHASSLVHEAQGQAELAAIKMARAKEILDRRIYKESSHGDRDYRALPEPSYFGSDNIDIPDHLTGGGGL